MGWLVYGENFTLQLMPDRCKRIAHLINKIVKLKYCNLKKFQELSGNLKHASFGITGGKGIFLPIYQAIKTSQDYVKIIPYLVAALKDWQILVHHLAENPTLVQILVSEYTDYLQYIDTCQLGPGGVIKP